MSSEETTELKNNVKSDSKATPKIAKKMLSAAEIKQRMGISETGDFPSWVVEEFKNTHVLRWISPSKFYQNENEIDQRGYEVVKDPRTGKVVKWGEMTLGAMPKDLAEEKKAEVRDKTRIQEDTIKDTMESKHDQLRYELQRQGYASAKAKSITQDFSYTKVKR